MYIDMHYFCSHVHGMHIINPHRRHTNCTLTLKCIVHIRTSGGLSVDCYVTHHSWKTPRALLLWRLHTLVNVLLVLYMYVCRVNAGARVMVLRTIKYQMNLSLVLNWGLLMLEWFNHQMRYTHIIIIIIMIQFVACIIKNTLFDGNEGREQKPKHSSPLEYRHTIFVSL